MRKLSIHKQITLTGYLSLELGKLVKKHGEDILYDSNPTVDKAFDMGYYLALQRIESFIINHKPNE